MQLFSCQKCRNPVFFENVTCERCASALGFLPDQMAMTTLAPTENGQWHALVDQQAPKRSYRS
ncbi:MAG: zinc-ribbon domain-containing protein, partial [Limnobacter sp.]|nr:zinc-ribbon domain-containing protein [Limnobacter sp.]